MKSYLQTFFDFVGREIQHLETRWLILTITALIMLVLRALGAQGLADVVGLIYIMYFVTFWRSQ